MKHTNYQYPSLPNVLNNFYIDIEKFEQVLNNIISNAIKFVDKNIGQIEFPISANVISTDIDIPSAECINNFMNIQGGALRTYPFDPQVDSVQVLLMTDGRPLNARVELLQGPNNNKQVVELYTEDGQDRPFFCILETPGSGNVVRIVNTAPVEFPMRASVVPNSIDANIERGPIIGGDVIIGGSR